MNGVEEAPEEGEVDVNALVPKVHIRGVNSFSSQDVENFAREHYSDDLYKRIQWVDDSSANIVYDTEVAAAEALQAFSTEEVADPLQVRPAKRLSTHPDVELFARQATESDVKVKNAHLYSRYYVDNVEFDPENPHNNRPGKRRFQDRGGRGDRGYRQRDYGYKRRRPEYDDEGYSRRSSRDEPFDVNLYDDDPKSLAARMERPGSRSSGDESRKKARFAEELFPDKQNGRLRNRSASPTRDGDGRFGFDDNQPRRRTARPRSPTPPRLRASRDNRGAASKLQKELFPEKRAAAGSALSNGHTGGTTTDLFPNHSSPPKGPRELMAHRRHEARDIDSERRQDQAIGRLSMDRLSLDGIDERDTHTRPDTRSRQRNDSKPRDLFSRISGGPKVESGYGRLHDRPDSSDGGGTGYSFKGAGTSNQFSILGASREQAQNPLVKELFPMKAGGGGGARELFDGKIRGRGKRAQAEDLF